MKARVYFGGANRRDGGALSRFAGTTTDGAHHDLNRDEAALRPDHPAVTQGRTLFPTRVFDVDQAPRVLVSGHNNAKTGAEVMKGPWRGAAIYTVTLEERATCPASCGNWQTCYGNAMPLARRHRHGEELILALDREIADLLREHPAGIAVRLHVLGDFWSVRYALAWYRWLAQHPKLRVWGYTANAIGSDIGAVLDAANLRWPERCVIRWSIDPRAEPAPLQAATVWIPQAEARQVVDGVICPAQTGATPACATCAICWAGPARDKRIVFLGHGRAKRGATGRATAAPAARSSHMAPSDSGAAR